MVEFCAEAMRDALDGEAIFQRIIQKGDGAGARELIERRLGENADARQRALTLMRRRTLEKIVRNAPGALRASLDKPRAPQGFEPALVRETKVRAG